MTDFSSIWQIAPREVARVLGTPFLVYRPAGAGPVTVAGNVVGTVAAWITADAALKAAKPMPADRSRGYAAFDPVRARVGDYLVGRGWSGGEVGTWFIESMDLPAPITVVQCNRVLSLLAAGAASPGPEFYSGGTAANASMVLAGWPASMLAGTKGERGDVNLPGDTRLPWVLVRLPVLPAGVVPKMGDFVVDDLGRRYIVSQSVGSSMGWSLSASLAVA